MEDFLTTKENLNRVSGKLVYEDNKSAIQAWTAYDKGYLNRETNYAPTTYPLDLTTVPGISGLPKGWDSDLNLDSHFTCGKASSPPLSLAAEKPARETSPAACWLLQRASAR